MALTVATQRFSLGSMAAVINRVTGNGTLKTWETGLSKVFFYIACTPDDAHCVTDKWFLNYNDAGSTVKNGWVQTDTAAPDTGEVWVCFGIGRP